MNWFTKLKKKVFFFLTRPEVIHSMLHALEPRRVVPIRDTFREQVIPALYNTAKTEVVESLEKACRVSLTCDASTSISTHSYVTVTAHFINNEWQLKSHILQTSVRSMFEAFCYCCWDVVDVEVPSRRQLHFFFFINKMIGLFSMDN